MMPEEREVSHASALVKPAGALKVLAVMSPVTETPTTRPSALVTAPVVVTVGLVVRCVPFCWSGMVTPVAVNAQMALLADVLLNVAVTVAPTGRVACGSM